MRKLKNNELNRKSVEQFKKSEKIPFILVLDNVRSLHNIGSAFRTADAFLLQSIYLCGVSATPPNKEIHKTALGAEDSVNWEYFENTMDAVQKLKENGYRIFALEQTEKSTSLLDFDIEKDEKYAFIFGHEVKGVQQDVINLCDGSIEIPQHGTKHSFNVSVSIGIVLWDLYVKYIGN
jgi:23S rRNA (guanosine2251-2'-O)-methyltransferase